MSRKDGSSGKNIYYEERGQLRSGQRFAARNLPYYSSVRELLQHHRRLLEYFSGPVTRLFRVDGRAGSLTQTIVRFRADHTQIEHQLRQIFLDLFREHTESPDQRFEVVVTFNAILANSEGTSFSVFYGLDHRAGNLSGASPELRFGPAVRVSTLADVASIPTSFDFESLIGLHRAAFHESGVRIVRFLNVVYIIYRLA